MRQCFSQVGVGLWAVGRNGRGMRAMRGMRGMRGMRDGGGLLKIEVPKTEVMIGLKDLTEWFQ